MRKQLKITFALILLTSLTMSSVLGIMQSESINLTHIALNGFSQDHLQKEHTAQAAYHETRIDNSVLYEAEEEDNKEKSLEDTFFSETKTVFLRFDHQGQISGESAISPQSLNILYCVFRI